MDKISNQRMNDEKTTLFITKIDESAGYIIIPSWVPIDLTDIWG